MGPYTPRSGGSDFSDINNSLRVLHFSNSFPPEDLSTLFRRLLLLSKTTEHPVLAHFLEKATNAVREEIRRLPAELRSLVPSFESALSLADDHDLRKGRLNGSIDGVLLCILQLGAYIGYCEHSASDFSHGQDGSRVLTGLGIGLLASSAVAIATRLEDIPAAGAEVVRIAIRVGVHVSNVSENLEPSVHDRATESWAYVITGCTPEAIQRELDDAHGNGNMPAASRIFISALSPTSVTVSGPPSRLQALFKTSAFFRAQKYATLPVYAGLCHAPHIFGARDVAIVVQTPEKAFGQAKPTDVLSTSTGRPFPATNPLELLQHVVEEIMTRQIAWDNVIQGVIDFANRTATSTIHLMVFQLCLPSLDLQKAVLTAVPDSKIEVEDMLQWTAADQIQARPRSSAQSPIAVIGMSCRMPGGAMDTEKMWELLEQGVDAHRIIPADRFDVETHHDPLGKNVNASHTSYGCFIDEPGLFDAPFFNMSPREAEQTDPMQRLALVTAAEALERAGFVRDRTPATQRERIGTWYGQASDDYREVNTAQEISTYFIPGGCRAFGPGRINYFFKFAGPSFNCDTACSSSLATIQAACTALWAGDVDTVVAGGLNILTNSDAFAGLSKGHFLTQTPNACKTWDAEADGYCRADGIGSIVLKRLDDAMADNDNILGTILATATNHSADAVSITHPHAGHQTDLTRLVLARAGVDPLDVSYVELHGTGTQAGDTQELQSVTDVFAPSTGNKRRGARQPLHIGAVKANLGHGEAAAGVTALLKVLLMLQKGAIPPHVGIKNGLNPKLPQDLPARRVHIPFELTEWQRPSIGRKKRIAAVNNFSAAGGNTCLLIEEGPARQTIGVDPRPVHVVAVSAKSKASLRGNIQKLLGYLIQNPQVALSDVAYTTTARKQHYKYRLVFHCADNTTLQQRLTSSLADIDMCKAIQDAPSIAFTFTGQGASEKSMNLELFHESPYFRDQILSLNALAQGQGFPSIIPAIDGSHPKDHEHSPTVAQLTLCCLEIALARYWSLLGVKPDVVIGHSLGEYAALCIAGVLSASDAIYLVGARARLLEERCTIGSHKMLAVRASSADIANAALHLPYEVACINGPKETVLSGTEGEMIQVADCLQQSAYRCTTLDVAFAFHSAQSDEILEEFEDIAQRRVVYRAPTLPVISPLLEKIICDDQTINGSYVRGATRNTVNFCAALEKAYGLSFVDDNTAWVEIGPHPVCCSFIKATLPNTNIAVGSLRRGENNWSSISESLTQLHRAGVEIEWNDFHKPFEPCAQLLDLPTYSWNDKNYWIQYNGNWALTKGNTFYDTKKGLCNGAELATGERLSFQTATVQKIVEEDLGSGSANPRVVMRSDLMRREFLAAANGHRMNGCGVVTSSIHADIAFTLAKYMLDRVDPDSKRVMDIKSLEVSRGLVANKNTWTSQWIQVTATARSSTADSIDFLWQNVDGDGQAQTEPFATATVSSVQSPEECLQSWAALGHLVQGRIDALDALVCEGSASRFTHSMAYALFANTLVDYAEKYRGMQAVVLSKYEAYADVTLSTKQAGDGPWTVPPYFIDSVAHLAGFVMNVSDASDAAKTFCVTPGWRSMRFPKPLMAGGQYRSYVKMVPTVEDATVYLGDVYVLQDGEIMGMVGGIRFRRYPRILLNRFFSAPDESLSPPSLTTTPPQPTPHAPARLPTPVPAATPVKVVSPAAATVTATATAGATTASASSQPAADSTFTRSLAIISAETGLDASELTNDAAFVNLGVDSLMSLVISEKFRRELGITIGSSVFLECPTIGALRACLDNYYG